MEVLSVLGELLRFWGKRLTGHGQEAAADLVRAGIDSYNEGHTESGKHLVQRAMRSSPGDAEPYVVLAQMAYAEGNLEEARANFGTALGIEPANQAALLGMAAALHASGSASDAIYFYLSYLDENREDVRAMLSLASAYQSTGQVDAALEIFERAVTLDPQDPDIHGQFGRALYDLGREEEALAHLRAAARLGSMDTEVYRALGLAHELRGQLAEARDQYERAIELDPRNAAALVRLATVLAESSTGPSDERSTLALQHAGRAIEILREDGAGSEDLAEAHWELGWIHYILGDWRASIDASRTALKYQPELTPVRFNLGLALLRAGECQEALAEYRRAVEEVKDPWDLRFHGIDDLKATMEVEPELNCRSEALELLQGRHRELSSDHRRASAG